MTRRSSSLSYVVFSLAAALFATIPAIAQQPPKKSVPVPDNARRPADQAKPASTGSQPVIPAPKVEPKGSVGAVMMADEPLRIESVGLTMQIPVNTQVQSTRINGRNAIQLIGEDSVWILNVQTPQTSNEAATIDQAVEQTLKLLQGSVGVVDPNQENVLETQAKVIENTGAMNLPGGQAARLYVSVPDGKARVVKGYTIFKPGSNQFVVFELLCGEVNFGKARVAYEASVATAQFLNNDDLATARMVGIKAGTNFLLRLQEQDWLEAMHPEGKEQWFRMYKPGLDGSDDSADELGYYGVRFWRGRRGEIDPLKKPANFSEAENQMGYLVRVRSRVISDKAIADNDGIFFMKADRSEEAWSFKTAAKSRDGKGSQVASEAGARLNDDLQIVKTEPGKATTTMRPPVKEGYISQYETFILPRILAKKGIEGEFGWYSYEAWPSAAVSYRKDVVKRDVEQNHVYVTSTLRPDAQAQVSTYDSSGKLILTQLTQDGIVREPIELPALKAIWVKKGLPTEK